jgi:hypothetical protein
MNDAISELNDNTHDVVDASKGDNELASRMIDFAPLVCHEWNNKSIDWCYYIYQAAPTKTQHAQKVAKQAAAARRASSIANAKCR